jgi:hypothetical protein
MDARYTGFAAGEAIVWFYPTVVLHPERLLVNYKPVQQLHSFYLVRMPNR